MFTSFTFNMHVIVREEPNAERSEVQQFFPTKLVHSGVTGMPHSSWET